VAERTLPPPPSDADMARMAMRKGMRKKRKKERDAEEEAVTSELNITAMMDMMTILLVFLLKSFGTNSANITLNEDLQLPQSTSTLKMDELIALTITTKQILVGDKAVVELETVNGPDGAPMVHIPAAALDNAGKGMLVVPIDSKLKEEIEKLKKIEQFNPNYQYKSQLSIIADGNTPYDVLTRVLYTAGKNSMDGYKFVVIGKGNQG
jgi:biopolymer transport protein ExbD